MTETWQRLRAARKAAGLTQKKVAEALGITRAGYAWFEWARPEGRVSPTVSQLQTIARLTKVPVEMLADDNTSDSDIWRVASAAARGEPIPTIKPHVSQQQQQHPAPRPPTQDIPARMRETFWRAVEFSATQQDPALVGCFDVDVGHGLRADFMVERRSVACMVDGQGRFLHHIGRVLLIEAIVHRPMSRHLLVWQPDVCDALREALPLIERALKIQVHEVATGEQAAATLLSLR